MADQAVGASGDWRFVPKCAGTIARLARVFTGGQ